MRIGVVLHNFKFAETMYRGVREVLQTTPTGRRLVKTYYKHAKEVSAIIQADAALRQEFAGLIIQCLSALKRALGGKPLELTREQKEKIKAWTEKVGRKASPELREAILAPPML